MMARAGCAEHSGGMEVKDCEEVEACQEKDGSSCQPIMTTRLARRPRLPCPQMARTGGVGVLGLHHYARQN
jgi:hypothetical protein